MPKRDRIHYDIGAKDFGDNSISVAINGGDFTSIKDALDSLQATGSVTGTNTGYIEDSGSTWEVDFFKGGSIIINGTYAGTYIVASNTGTQIYITGLEAIDPSDATTYIVWVASNTKWYQIKVFPGQYTENNSSVPLRLLDYVVISADVSGVDVTTTVLPQDVTKTLFRSSINGYGSLRGLCIQNVTGGSGYGMLIDSGSNTYLYSVEFYNCDNAVSVQGTGVFAYMDYTEFYNFTQVAVSVTAGAEMWWTLGYADNGTTVLYVDGNTAEARLTTCDFTNSLTNGIYLDNGAYVDFNGVHVEDCTYAIRFGTGGGSLRGNALYSEDNTSYDIYDGSVVPNFAIVRVNGTVDSSKFNIINDLSQVYYYGHDDASGKEGFTIRGKFKSPWANELFVSQVSYTEGDYPTIKDALGSLVVSGVPIGAGVGYVSVTAGTFTRRELIDSSITINGTYAGTYYITNNGNTRIHIKGLELDDLSSVTSYTIYKASDIKAYIVKVMPGTYTEDNSLGPIRLLDYVSVVGEQTGIDYSTVIKPKDTTKPLFASATGGFGGLRFVCLDGGVANTSYGLLIDSGSHNYMYSLLIENFSKAIVLTGAGVFAYMDYWVIQDCGVGIEVLNDAQMWSVIGYIYTVNSPSETTGVYVDGTNSLGAFTTLDIVGVFTNALYVDGGSIVEFTTMRVKGGSTNGLRIGFGGGKIIGNAVNLSSDTAYHLVDDTVWPLATAIFRVNGMGDSSKVVSTNSHSTINFYGYDEVVGDEGFAIGGRFKTPFAETVTVSALGGAQGDYITIKDAVNAIGMLSSASKPYSILIYPGVYVEDNPITMPQYVTLATVGGIPSVKIVAQNPNSNLIVMDIGGQIQGLTVSGATGAAGVYYAGGSTSAVVMLDMQIDNCLYGLYCTGIGSQAYISRVRFTGTMPYPVNVYNGATFFLKTARVISSGNVNSVTASGNSNVQMADFYCKPVGGGGNGIYIDDTSMIYSNSAYINGVDYALRLGPTGANNFDGYLDVYNSVVYDIYAEGTTLNTIDINGHIIRRKVEIGSNHFIGWIYDDFLKDFEVNTATNRFAVGSIQTPSESMFGQGDHKHKYEEVLTNTNGEIGTWISNTAEAIVNDGVNFDVFPSLNADACMYVGWNTTWGGLRYICTTAISGGSFVWEYWNGSNWTSFHTMVTERNAPYTAYSGAFKNVAQEHIRFDTGIITDWASKSLNGITRYWVRARITSTISVQPTLDLITIHADSMSIRKDGTTHYFGSTRYFTFQDLVQVRNSRIALQSSIPEILYLANSMGLYDQVNVLNDGEVNEIMFEPYTLGGTRDSSCKIGIDVVMITPATTGNVELRTDITVVLPGTTVYDGSNTKVTLSTITPVSATSLQSTLIEMTTYLSEYPVGSVLYARVYRDARPSNVNDTVAESVVITGCKLQFVKWKENIIV